jgi:hypothetical protein
VWKTELPAEKLLGRERSDAEKRPSLYMTFDPPVRIRPGRLRSPSRFTH